MMTDPLYPTPFPAVSSRRLLAIYGVASAVFVLGIFVMLHLGRALSGGAALTPHAATAAVSVWTGLWRNLQDPLARLLLQLVVIVTATKAAGAVAARAGQPAVVGEMAAGILLGPSLLGWVWPAGSAFIFQASSLGALQLFSQIGVCLFMFVIGLELDIGDLKRRAQTALVVSHSSIMLPFLLGAGSALLLYPSYGPPGAPFVSFALFMGVAMSITAFPVLARILSDRGLMHTPLGVTATACAAADDVTAWIILALVVAIAHGGGMASILLNLGLLVGFVLVMLLVARPALARMLPAEATQGPHALGAVAAALVFMTACALVTQAIGVHALFGAFLAGVVMPRRHREFLAVRLENVSAAFLLPLFFAFTGLRTQIDLLNTPQSWLVAAGVVAVAVSGKVVGSMVPARLTGMDWRQAFQLGALMNTRGLVELIALNIGYDLGILPPRIFSILVLMALATTFMTGPLLDLANRRFPGPGGEGGGAAPAKG